MDKFSILQFYSLLRKEVLEHRNLFIGAPLVLALLILVAMTWWIGQGNGEFSAELLAGFSMLIDGLAPLEVVQFVMPLAAPFLIALYVCSVIYLINTLYQDRKEMSILFWQSMPVSNLKTVISKLVTIIVVAPLFYVAVIFVMYLITIVWLIFIGNSYDVEFMGAGFMFTTVIASSALLYLSAVCAFLWLLPSMGWLLLFSAFAKKTPLLWAVGVFILVGFLEDFIFGTQFLGNWVDSRTANPNQYMIFEFSSFFDRVFNYDTLFGVLVGSILIAGAVYMRRFAD